MPVPTPQSTIHGYVFDGLRFERACVDRQMLVINKETKTFCGVDPAKAVWYTRREFQNAVAYCQSKGLISKDLDLNSVVPSAALLNRLRDQGSLRTTQDHILHMLAAGKGVLSPVELLGYQKQAAEWTRLMVEAYQKGVASQIQIA